MFECIVRGAYVLIYVVGAPVHHTCTVTLRCPSTSTRTTN